MSAVGLGGEVNGGGGGRERAHLPPALELRVEEQQQQLSQGSRTPAGAQAESSMMGMGMMDFLSSRGNGMSRRGRRTVGLPGPSGLATAREFPFASLGCFRPVLPSDAFANAACRDTLVSVYVELLPFDAGDLAHGRPVPDAIPHRQRVRARVCLPVLKRYVVSGL